MVVTFGPDEGDEMGRRSGWECRVRTVGGRPAVAQFAKVPVVLTLNTECVQVPVGVEDGARDCQAEGGEERSEKEGEDHCRKD